MSFELIQGDCLQVMAEMPADSFDLVFGSPPYMDARTYGIDACRGCQEWVDWMLDVSEAATRVSKGLVLWVVSGVQRELNYWPGCEGLAWEWWKRGNQLWRPCIWWKVDEDEGGTGIPGSGGKQWLRNDWEYVLAFKKEGHLPWADPLVFGHEPVCDQLGGEMSNRTVDGQRVNDPWKTVSRGGQGIGGRRKNGEKMRGPGPTRRKNGDYKDVASDQSKDKTFYLRRQDGSRKDDEGSRPMPKIANPGNCIIVKARVGGGHMGSDLCHDNEAPFPEALAEFFVRSFAPEGGRVLDPFSGSGTTVAVAHRWKRHGVGIDIRESMRILAERRLAQEVPMMFV